MRDRIHRELRRREYVPGDVGPAKLDIGRIASIARQQEMLGREASRFLRLREPPLQMRVRFRVVHDCGDRAPMHEQRRLAVRDMRVVAQRAARSAVSTNSEALASGRSAREKRSPRVSSATAVHRRERSSASRVDAFETAHIHRRHFVALAIRAETKRPTPHVGQK